MTHVQRLDNCSIRADCLSCSSRAWHRSAGNHGRTSPLKSERITDSLVAEALESNLGLDQAAANVDQRLAILDQARAEYLPQIDLQLRYSEGEAADARSRVPALDLEFQFLRDREQDSFVRLTQPIYDAESRPSGAAPPCLRRLALRLEAYRLRLARDVRQAYYRWLAARESIGVLEATLGSPQKTSASTTACTAMAR